MTEHQRNNQRKMICCRCSTEQEAKATKSGRERLPRGWKRLADQAFCEACWKDSYILRAITFPVVGPINPKQWPEFRESLQHCWTQSTGLANWITSELYASDCNRTPEMKKLPPMRSVYLYPQARERFPDVSPRSVATMEHKFAAKYRSLRYKVIWTGEASLPNYRYPVAFPVPSSVWNATFNDTNQPLVDFQLTDSRWTVRLRGGPSFRPQLRVFRDIVENRAVKCELSLYRKRANSNDNRIGTKERTKEGNLAYFRIMAKIVAWLPRTRRRQALGVQLKMRTSQDSFLVVEREDKIVWKLNADHVRRWTAEHGRQLKRWNEDKKSGQRSTAVFGRRRSGACQKHTNRLRSFCQESAANFARFAIRMNASEVVYDDSVRGYCESFCWAQWTEILRAKLDEFGVELSIGQSVSEKRNPKSRE